MSELLNIFTKGTKGITIKNDSFKSEIFVPTNEDYCFIGKVVSFNEEFSLAQVHKAWDDDKKIFFVWVKYAEKQNEKVLAIDIIIGSWIQVFRVGDFNTQPQYAPEGFELHTEQANKVSFLSLI